MEGGEKTPEKGKEEPVPEVALQQELRKSKNKITQLEMAVEGRDYNISSLQQRLDYNKNQMDETRVIKARLSFWGFAICLAYWVSIVLGALVWLGPTWATDGFIAAAISTLVTMWILWIVWMFHLYN